MKYFESVFFFYINHTWQSKEVLISSVAVLAAAVPSVPLSSVNLPSSQTFLSEGGLDFSMRKWKGETWRQRTCLLCFCEPACSKMHFKNRLWELIKHNMVSPVLTSLPILVSAGWSLLSKMLTRLCSRSEARSRCGGRQKVNAQSYNSDRTEEKTVGGVVGVEDVDLIFVQEGCWKGGPRANYDPGEDVVWPTIAI